MYPEHGVHELTDLLAFIGKKRIEDEYGQIISREIFNEIVTERSWFETEDLYRTQAFLRQNHAVPGPKNLLRSKIDGQHCIGHGDGTYDLIVGEFC